MKAALNQAGKGASFSSTEMVDAESAKLIARQFASTRQFATSFDKYFREVLRMAADNTMQVSKASFAGELMKFSCRFLQPIVFGYRSEFEQ